MKPENIKVGHSYVCSDGAKRRVQAIEDNEVEFTFAAHKEGDEPSRLPLDHFASLAIRAAS